MESADILKKLLLERLIVVYRLIGQEFYYQSQRRFWIWTLSTTLGEWKMGSINNAVQSIFCHFKMLVFVKIWDNHVTFQNIFLRLSAIDSSTIWQPLKVGRGDRGN